MPKGIYKRDSKVQAKRYAVLEAWIRDNGPPRKGVKLSPEHKAKISRTKMGIPLSIEHRAKLSEAGKGRQCSAKVRAKIGALNRGKKLSSETCAKISASKLGVKHSPEHRAKEKERSQNHMGNVSQIVFALQI